MNAQKLIEKDLVKMKVRPAPECLQFLNVGPSFAMISEEDGRLYRGHYEKEIDSIFISGEISYSEITKALIKHTTQIYQKHLTFAEESATQELLRIVTELQKLTPPWQA